MTSFLDSIRLVSYNCRGWNSGVTFLRDYSTVFDLCFLQEHWLFQSQLALLDFSNDFSSHGISGMDDSVLLRGRPYGGCGIIFRKSLRNNITILNASSKSFCSVRLRVGDSTILLICVYFPTDYHSDVSNDNFMSSVGELCGFIDSQAFDFLLIGGDFNTDLSFNSTRSCQLRDLMMEFDLICADSLSSSIQFTYVRDDGLARSWPDHFLISEGLVSKLSMVSTLQTGSNLSDHLPLFATLALQLRFPLAPVTVQPSKPTKTNWSKVSDLDIQRFRDYISAHLPVIDVDLLLCHDSTCTVHASLIDSLVDSFLNCIHWASFSSLPTLSQLSKRRCIPGWNTYVKGLKGKADFWHRVWVEAGGPTSGTLYQIKRKAKSRYKYQVRKLMRRREYVSNQTLVSAFSNKNPASFWKEVKRVRGSKKSNSTSFLDGLSDPLAISNALATKFSHTLNSHKDKFDEDQLKIDDSSVNCFCFTDNCVLEAFSHLKPKKSDGSDLDSNHFIMAMPVIVDFLTSLFTIVIRHGYLPPSLKDCVLVPVPKPGKDPSSMDSYRPIALASTLSKLLEWCILIQFREILSTSDLQFGFKPGLSTTLCTGTVKNVISHFLHRGSSVFGCFLDASKAFDLVKHSILFEKLVSRGLPNVVVRFLSRWYTQQMLSVRWDDTYSRKFGVSNGVRQGGVLSPILFAIYLDTLLCQLQSSDIGCSLGGVYAGAFAYADDVVLLAPSLSSLRLMLGMCEEYACHHGLSFNPSKTQLIQFRWHSQHKVHTVVQFSGLSLPLLDEVVHLGHILSFDLSDDKDVLAKCKDMVRKANSLFYSFKSLSPHVFTYLFRAFCLSLYGCALWNLSTGSIKSLEVSFNKILRRIWSLPYNSHTRIVHQTAGLNSLFNLIFKRTTKLFEVSQKCPSSLVKYIFVKSSSSCFSFLGFNLSCGSNFVKSYSVQDYFKSKVIKDLRLAAPFLSLHANFIDSIICSLST